MRSMLTIEQQQKPPRFSPQPTNGGGASFVANRGGARNLAPGYRVESGGGRRGSGIPAARRVHQHETKDPPANSVSGTGRRRERTVWVSMPSADGPDVSNSGTDRGRLGVLSIRLAALAIQRPQAVRYFDNAGSIGRFR